MALIYSCTQAAATNDMPAEPPRLAIRVRFGADVPLSAYRQTGTPPPARERHRCRRQSGGPEVWAA
jgi:hypothetical protein